MTANSTISSLVARERTRDAERAGRHAFQQAGLIRRRRRRRRPVS